MRVFCENCGREFEAGDSGTTLCDLCRNEVAGGNEDKGNAAVNVVSRLAGLEGAKGFRWSGLFSEVFRSHSDEEYSRFWSTGAVGNIPSINMVDTGWPHPWMFVRGCLLMVAFCVILFIGWKISGDNTNFLPGLMAVGSLLMPLTILLFFFEMNARRNVSFSMVMKTFLIGGALSMLLAMPLFRLAGLLQLGWLGASAAGIVEEIAKLLAVVIFVRCVSQAPYILNGLLFGAAVGAGFAAFESMGYAMSTLLNRIIELCVVNSEHIAEMFQNDGAGEVLASLTHDLTSIGSDDLFYVVCLRGCLVCLTGHILWTGMTASALWMVRGRQKFRLGMLFNIRFLRIFLIAVVSHMLWNCPWNPTLVTAYDKFILLGIVNWIVIFAIIARGLAQLKAEKEHATPEVEEAVEEVIVEQRKYVESIVVPRHPVVVNMPDNDHLDIHSQVEESVIREKERQPRRFEGRAWQKYYKRER